MSRLARALLLLVACAKKDADVGDTDTDAPPLGDTADTPGDTKPPVDDTEVGEDDEPGPDTDADDPSEPGDTGWVAVQVCYPGADGLGTTCLPTVRKGSWGSDWTYPTSSDGRYRAPVRFLDLEALDAATRLAPNFVLSEIAQVHKGRWAVVAPALAEKLQGVRDDVGGPLHVNSGYRNPAYNAGVGGATYSRHMWGDAADVRADDVSLEELGAICLANDAGYVGFYEGHVHCDWRDEPLDTVLFGVPLTQATGRLADVVRTARLVAGPVWTAPAEGWDEGEPLRVWTATDAAGNVLATATGRAFVPPAGAAWVRVDVGREVVLRERVR